MKGSKATTYILLVLVVAIWGYVIYTIFAKVSGTDNNMPVVALKPMAASDLSYYRWNHSLEYDTLYRSPFSAEDHIPDRLADAAFVEPEPAYYEEPIDPLDYAPTMDVQYLGYIENESQKQRIALLQINGKQYYMHPKEQIDGVTLISISPADIQIKTEYQTFTIVKQ